MNPQDTLMDRASALLENLSLQRHRLGQAEVGESGGSANKLVRTLVGQKLAALTDRLKHFIENEIYTDDLTRAHAGYLRIDQECKNLFGECLAFLIAPTIRTHGFDDGACAIVERMLRQLGQSVSVPWPHLTTLADAEFFATASQVIRLRYPSSNIWDYVVAAHEFGHFIGPRWPAPNGDRTGYQTFLDIKDLGPKAHLEEYFADLFATFVLGPAYLCACLAYRFDPASQGDDYHPNDRYRAVWILTGIEELKKASKGQSAEILDSILTSQSQDWTAAVAASGASRVEDRTVATLRTRARRLWTDLTAWVREAAYVDLSTAMSLRADFFAKRRPVGNPEVRDVLTAAWLMRVEDGNDLYVEAKKNAHTNKLAAIDSWAKTICRNREG
jgi:hypothetical protein